VVEVDGGRHLNVDADVLILELGVDERADDGRGCAGLIRTGGDGDARADLHGGFLIASGADARALQNLGVESVSNRFKVAEPTVTAKSVA